MKIYKIFKKFELPEYDVPIELELALKKGLDKVKTDESKPTFWIVNYLKWLINQPIVPVDDLFNGFTVLLYVERHFANEEIKKHKLYNQSLCYDKNENSFTITVPYLNKHDPFISAGNCVHLHDNVSKTEHVLYIVDIWNGYLDAEPYGSRTPVQWYSAKRKYDISFHLSHYSLRSARDAIEWIKFWKFKDDILNPSARKVNTYKKHEIYSWFNPNIMSNLEQKKAIHDIINKTAFPAPYILFGPPGTGKSATIVEAISQIYCLNNTNKVLVCTSANSPADDITKMLQKNLPSNTILRLCSISRETKLKDIDVIRCANVYFENENKKKRKTMPNKEIMKKRVIICTLTSSWKLKALELGCSYFSHIFIDEAGQATEPETWIPISLLVDESRTKTQVVLLGDPEQLGPVVKPRFIKHLLGISMMERLMNSDCYKNENTKQFYITKLTQNFRCHSSILKVPNELFYKGELLCCGGSDILQGVNWKYLLNRKFPIIFHAVFGNEEKDGENPSPFNSDEMIVCLEYVQKLKEANKFREENIGIITPFKKQKILINHELSKLGITKIEVGTVEHFQGLEKDVIIISTVRSRLLEHNGKKHIGFLSDQKRFNVSITRAKSLLIVIGNPNTLQHDETWFHFIKYCVDNNACIREKSVLRNSIINFPVLPFMYWIYLPNSKP